MSNNHKIIGLYGALSSSVCGNSFPKNAFHGETNFFGQIYGEVILNGRTNDQIMPRWRSFINDKCIFQLNTVNLPVKIKINIL